MSNLERIVRAALKHRNDLNRICLTADELDDLGSEVVHALVCSHDLAVVDPVPEDDDEAVLVYAGGIACEAWPLSPLAANGAPTVPVWTSLYEEGLRRHLVVFDTEDLPRWKRRLVHLLERGT